jgi:hypothetical protein
MFKVLTVNGKRYLINVGVSEESQDNQCEAILKNVPEDAVVDIVDPVDSDFKNELKTLN